MEGPEHSIIVIGEGQNKLALELGLQKVIKLLDYEPIRLCWVRNNPPRDVKDAVPSTRGRILGLRGDPIKALRFVVEKGPLLSPTRYDAVGRDGATFGQLLVEARIVILGHVNGYIECHSRETSLKRRLGRILLSLLITALPNRHDTSLSQRGLVQLLQ
ncbi:hypothetical protein PspLS_09921 [Pyricularia sp. CBS 133598]|nr:hypothetical protein PspLS_09921 [Pyricularia sp. CBS 133598]